jgi:mRNA interferase MazF
MRRGELYRVRRPPGDPRPARVFVLVARQTVIDSSFPAVTCAPVHSGADGLATQVAVGIREGLKHQSWILCDALTSIPKERLTDYVGSLAAEQESQLKRAMAVALDLI